MWMQILVYVAIFLAKMVEVSLATVRIVFVGRGEKVKGAVVGFFEVLIWVIVVGNVLGTLSEDPIKVIVYCLAFAAGNYLGVTIENKLAIGNASIQAIVPCDLAEELSDTLRGKGFGVTILHGEGRSGCVEVMIVFMKRKALPEAINVIQSVSETIPITVNDVRSLRGGYIKK